MVRLLPIALVVGCTFSSVIADERARSKMGPFVVETADDLIIEDSNRGKKLSCKIHYPKSGGPHPVILFSHGYGGNKDAFGPVGKHWASHGYVVIHPTHEDGIGRTKNGSRIGADDRPAGRAPFGRLTRELNDPEKIRDRVSDLVLILDNLDRLPKSVPGLKGRVDAKSIGVGGHSFGAYTAMLIGGVTVDLGKNRKKSFFDRRVKCILPISGQGTGQQGLTDTSWSSLKLPMMTITGTRDQGVGGQGVEWRKEPYLYSPPGDKYLVVIDGANHFSFGGALGMRAGEITDIVKLCSTNYWDAYLKGSPSAKEYLRSNKLPRDTSGKCVFEKK